MALKRPQPAPVVVPAASDEDEIITLPAPKRLRVGLPCADEEKAAFNPDAVLAGATDLRNRLAAFLPTLKAADEQLEQERLAGQISHRRMEIDDSEDEDGSSSGDYTDGSSSEGSEVDTDEEEEDEEEEENEGESQRTIAQVLITNLLAGREENVDPVQSKRKRRPRAPYIEMNLGLGVLEELKPAENDADDRELNDRRELVSRILELRKLQHERDGESDSDGGGGGGETVERLALPLEPGRQEARKVVVIEELEE